ncbi:uncharacterized protein LOC129615947 [Condylostylus longicornis]|uniref:uncharacterized protein LOC129615947 n=1 Tax=Condylostylus longicornis TaxID=2530218 RepID=UPI00244E0C3F|nr:uncharacterized protein LOC129615947 [Condylostylus longicornis]
MYSFSENPDTHFNIINVYRAPNIISTKFNDFLDEFQNCIGNTNYTIDDWLERLKERTVESYKSSNIKRKNNQHWIDKEVIEAVKVKNGWFSKWSRDSSNTFLEHQYKYYRNKVTSMRRYKKQKYFEKELAEHCTDSSKIWQCINNMLYNRVSNKSGVDLLKGLSEQDAEIKINNLNKHFAGIGESMTKNFENSLNLSNNLIKICNEYLCDSIALIINKSLAEGAFPEALKLGRIVSIFKSGDKSDYNNYRPICTPGTSKIIEKVVYTQVSRFLENNKILSKTQYGYRIKSTTETAVGDMINRVQNLKDANKMVSLLFMDLSKAFDTVDHKILLMKLRSNGIKGLANKWFSSYLQNRKQFTHIGANKSEN